MPKEIVIEISEDGKEVTVEAIGYHGKGCMEEVMAFVQALGKSTQVRKKTEFYRLVRTTRTRHRARLRGTT